MRAGACRCRRGPTRATHPRSAAQGPEPREPAQVNAVLKSFVIFEQGSVSILQRPMDHMVILAAHGPPQTPAPQEQTAPIHGPPGSGHPTRPLWGQRLQLFHPSQSPRGRERGCPDLSGQQLSGPWEAHPSSSCSRGLGEAGLGEPRDPGGQGQARPVQLWLPGLTVGGRG